MMRGRSERASPISAGPASPSPSKISSQHKDTKRPSLCLCAFVLNPPARIPDTFRSPRTIFMQSFAPLLRGDRMSAMVRTDSRTDAQLMAAFLDRKDEEAFEVLVGRHETMVLRVCARVLRDEHGARDAAQAVFLVLARKAAAVDLARPLGPWLHHVAYGVAVSALREREARRERERKVMSEQRDRGESDEALREMLDGELDGLPE